MARSGFKILLDDTGANDALKSFFVGLSKLSLREDQVDGVLDQIDKNWSELIGFVRTRNRKTHTPTLFFARLQPTQHFKNLERMIACRDTSSFLAYLEKMDASRVTRAKRVAAAYEEIEQEGDQ